ncbi:phosphatidate cytidylyltransferase [Bifidobacterium sp. ESL0798]|uniref:phosphatidate cytidylyltransferase n=1 Tax=unclassified Bifidobacterium TaxID=2608897 RepID=UPI0023F795BA|nr:MULTISPECIES: phosphatidate cytidylyltransferase [unclassified Bifidobacterium]WEV52214.1 phosphatidate cytidylyltransferase [Bifidobacterium sp. ESL0704]WEV73288.1 phosphatidate cytidylyltransferase [Bifidobacterium sp. ESL0798]
MTSKQGHEAGDEVSSALNDINKKTGRNMPQAVATAVFLVVLIVACLLIRIDLYVVMIAVFLVLALRELHVSFATVHLYIPLIVLWLCCVGTLLSIYYVPDHVLAAGVGITVSTIAVAIAANLRHNVGKRLAGAIEGKLKAAQGIEKTAAPSAANKKNGESSIDNVAVSVFLVLYILVLASCIILPETFNGHPVAHAIMLIFLPALSDTGGLFFGAFFGRHKLSPRISPKKSVEGLCGSILFAMVGALVIFAITYPGLWATRWWMPILTGVMVGVIGTFGDLCASMLKRDMGLKDMGHLLKGHGGVIDRVDSILLCAPFFTVLLWATGM